jgi:sulfopyruvate decarboxylase TPP-binding subunit
MTKKDFVYTGLRGHKNIIYENVTNNERLKNLMKMFSGDPLIVKIPYSREWWM